MRAQAWIKKSKKKRGGTGQKNVHQVRKIFGIKFLN
jgi:hypothetical protein